MTRQALIIEVFSYSLEEQAAFPYLKRYMTKVSRIRGSVLKSSAGQERYMLAGLFLTYRMCNLWGHGFSTLPSDIHTPVTSIHARRLATYRLITGKDITSTEDYLTAIGLDSHPIAFLKLAISPGRFLYRFVAKG